MKYIDHIAKISACENAANLTDALAFVSERQGFPSVLFGLKASKAARYDAAWVATNYAPAWRERYEKSALHLVDTTVAHALHRLRPLVWDQRTFKTGAESQFYEEAAGFGLKSGITFPIHGPKGEFGMLSLATDQTFAWDEMQAAVASLSWMRDYVFEISSNFVAGRVQQLTQSPLTPRESECLKWLTTGKTSWEIAKILICSEATINFHISNIIKKLGVYSRQQAVVKSLKEGWISFE
ncbi:MAG: LuxR family transcriptional regulator [Pararobbsia sp.]